MTTMTRWIAASTLWLVLIGTVSVATAQNRQETARAWSPAVQVTHVTEEKGRQPSVGAEVVLETWVQSARGEK